MSTERRLPERPWWRRARVGQHPLWLRALRVVGLVAVGAFLLVSALVLVGALIFGGPVVQ